MRAAHPSTPQPGSLLSWWGPFLARPGAGLRSGKQGHQLAESRPEATGSRESGLPRPGSTPFRMSHHQGAKGDMFPVAPQGLGGKGPPAGSFRLRLCPLAPQGPQNGKQPPQKGPFTVAFISPLLTHRDTKAEPAGKAGIFRKSGILGMWTFRAMPGGGVLRWGGGSLASSAAALSGSGGKLLPFPLQVLKGTSWARKEGLSCRLASRCSSLASGHSSCPALDSPLKKDPGLLGTKGGAAASHRKLETP